MKAGLFSTYINPEKINIESKSSSVVNDIEIIKDENGVFNGLFLV